MEVEIFQYINAVFKHNKNLDSLGVSVSIG